jgi:cell division transport system permease protein
VIAISFALPSTLLLTLHNLQLVAPDVDASARLSVLLSLEASLDEAMTLRDEISSWTDVDTVSVISQEQALAEFVEQTGLSTLLDSLDRNPLPHTLTVSLVHRANQARAGRLTEALQSLERVDRVVQDTRWIARLNEGLAAGWRWAVALGGAMVLGAVLALANTLHLAIDARRDEILVVRLIGGSAAFTRRPFLYTGIFYGGGGGLLAALLLWLVSIWLVAPVNSLFQLYDSPGQLQGPGPIYPIALTALGASLGWLASFVASERYLSRLR